MERIKPQESLENIRERAIREAQASPKSEDVAARYGKTDVAEVIREIMRITEQAVLNKSDPDAERQYLRTALIECGVDWATAALLTQAVFAKLKASQSMDTSLRGKAGRLLRHAVDVIKNRGES